MLGFFSDRKMNKRKHFLTKGQINPFQSTIYQIVTVWLQFEFAFSGLFPHISVHQYFVNIVRMYVFYFNFNFHDSCTLATQLFIC